MITLNGFSKDPMIQPDGIVVTWGKDLIQEKGGLRAFVRYFLECMKDENDFWMQKCKNRPTQDILYVYIIISGRVAYRCYYGGYQKGTTTGYNGDGRTWSKRTVITWPRIILAGPVKKAPYKIYLKGFQGFRYCTKLF